MPYDIKYQKDGGAIVAFDGVVSAKEAMQSDQDVYTSTTHPIKNVPYIISDYLNIEEVDWDAEDLKTSASKDKEAMDNNPDLILALVGNTDLLFGLSRIWHSYIGESERTWIFRTRENAENWVKMKKKKK